MVIIHEHLRNTKEQFKMDFKVILKISLMHFLIISLINLVTSEWIDLPQFSDESKVYRIPFTKSNRHNIPSDKSFNTSKKTLLNSTKNIARSKGMMQVPLIVNLEMTTLSYTVVNTNNSVGGPIITIKDIVTITNKSMLENRNAEKKLVTPLSQMLVDDCNEKKIEHVSDHTNTIGRYTWTLDESENWNEKTKLSFLHYLPIELIRRVHTILLGSAPITIGSKQNYLMTFEKSMLHKLKSRLAPVLNYVRRKRGSNWGDRDDHVGFPSLEGALLAISFLTFAVYLVQLVMMLLKNLTNNGANTTNTVLVNRNKRSGYLFSEDSVRILEYLDRYPNN